MTLHVLACDYTDANGVGKTTRMASSRPPFWGGTTIALNAALFSTTLLACESSVFQCQERLHVLLVPTGGCSFCLFHSVARHAINCGYLSAVFEWYVLHKGCCLYIKYCFYTLALSDLVCFPCGSILLIDSLPTKTKVVLWIITTSFLLAAIFLLLDDLDLVFTFLGMAMVIGFLLPAWKCQFQRRKVLLWGGAWDIPAADTMQLDYRVQ
jgi:hypothetical protein